MPELPEVEVVRRGLLPFTDGARAGRLEVLDPRSLRRSPGGEAALRSALAGRLLAAPVRRGKFLWIPFADQTDAAVVVHLGMSGQVRVDHAARPDPRHVRLRLPVTAADGREAELRFVDQRIFGGWWLDRLETDPATGERIPTTAAHIGLDPLHPLFDPDAVHDRWQHVGARLRRRCLGLDNVLVHEPGQARRCRLGRRGRGAPHPGQRGLGTGVQRSQRTATPHDSERGRRPPRPGDRRRRLHHVIYGPRWAAARSGGASSSRSL